MLQTLASTLFVNFKGEGNPFWWKADLFECRPNYFLTFLDHCEFKVSTLVFISLYLDGICHFGLIWSLFMVFLEFTELQNLMNDLEWLLDFVKGGKMGVHSFPLSHAWDFGPFGHILSLG